MKPCVRCGKVPKDGWYDPNGLCYDCANGIPESTKERTGKPFYKKAWFIVVAYLCLFYVAFFLATSVLERNAEQPAPPVDTPPMVEAATEAPRPTEEVNPALLFDVLTDDIEEVSGSGKGDDVIEVEEASKYVWCKIEFQHDGESNFIVDDIRENDLIINEIGSWYGDYLFSPGEHIYEITADGNWSYLVTKIEKGSRAGASGSGDSVTGWFDAVGSGEVSFQHSGESNFIVHLFCPDTGRIEYYVNEIGRYEGTMYVEMNPSLRYVWLVTADGPWSISMPQ